MDMMKNNVLFSKYFKMLNGLGPDNSVRSVDCNKRTLNILPEIKISFTETLTNSFKSMELFWKNFFKSSSFQVWLKL